MKKAQKMINNNIGMKILSVFIAVLIWVLVANTNDPVVTKRFSDVRVAVENENALTDNGYAYEILEGDRVSFTIKGKKSIVNNMMETDFQVVADFSKLSLTDAVPIDITSKKYADQLEISLGNTNTMKIKKDEIINVSVPVNVYVSGEVADGYAVGTTVATPNLIKITGPKNILSNAKEIRAEVEVEGISKDVTTSVKPKLFDMDGNLIESTQIEIVQASINVSIGLWRTKKVKVNLSFEGEPKPGYLMTSFDYQPKTVLAAADDSIYDELDSLDLASVSLDGADETYEKDIPVSSDSFPDGVILAETLNSIKVNAKIEKIKDRTLNFARNDLIVKGNKEGYRIEYDSNNHYFIKMEGGDNTIKAVEVKDLAPWIDISGLEEGEHTVKIHAKEKEGIAINDTSSIQITLSK